MAGVEYFFKNRTRRDMQCSFNGVVIHPTDRCHDWAEVSAHMSGKHRQP